MGKKRTNPKLKLLHGSNKRYVQKTVKGKPVIGIWRCPSWLNKPGKRLWKDLGNRLARLGVLTELDKAAFEGLCSAYGRIVEMEELIQKEGHIVEDQRGSVKKNPILTVYNQAFGMFMKLCQEFGCTPVGRNQVAVDFDPLDDDGEDLLTPATIPKRRNAFTEYMRDKDD